MKVNRYVITGTDTNIGKTVFAAALTHALAAYYWKPVQTGSPSASDSEVVMHLGNRQRKFIVAESYQLQAPLSPLAAAAQEQITIQPEKLMRLPTHSSLIIEGAGGLMVPLTEQFL